MNLFNKENKIYFAFCFLLLCNSTIISQDIVIYDTNLFGLRNITPSIIIDEDGNTGDYKVYSMNEFGLRHILPDEIIENNEYNGTWRVYRVSNLGLKEITHKQVAEENSFDGTINIYDVNSLGLKDILPSTIIEKDAINGDIKLYNVNNFGLREIFPFEFIRKDGDIYSVYAVNKMGFPDIIPTRVIEINENPSVFGILLLPSINKIIFDSSHNKIKTIKHIKSLPENELDKEGWIKSKPKSKKQQN